MIFRKHRHYCSPFPWPNFIIGTKEKLFNLEKIVNFDNSCKYELPGEDQHDVNKLFGLSFGLHHINSDRIGWRYNPEKNKMEIVLYSYFDKIRIPTIPIYDADLGEELDIKLEIKLEKNQRTVIATVNDKSVKITRLCNLRWSWFKYTLGGYFGGNRTAPHEMICYELIK